MGRIGAQESRARAAESPHREGHCNWNPPMFSFATTTPFPTTRNSWQFLFETCIMMKLRKRKEVCVLCDLLVASSSPGWKIRVFRYMNFSVCCMIKHPQIISSSCILVFWGEVYCGFQKEAKLREKMESVTSLDIKPRSFYASFFVALPKMLVEFWVLPILCSTFCCSICIQPNDMRSNWWIC